MIRSRIIHPSTTRGHPFIIWTRALHRLLHHTDYISHQSQRYTITWFQSQLLPISITPAPHLPLYISSLHTHTHCKVLFLPRLTFLSVSPILLIVTSVFDPGLPWNSETVLVTLTPAWNCLHLCPASDIPVFACWLLPVWFCLINVYCTWIHTPQTSHYRRLRPTRIQQPSILSSPRYQFQSLSQPFTKSAFHQSSLTLDPVDQLLGLRQGDWSIEDYVQQFCELVYQVPLYEVLFKDLFQFGLNEPVKSRLPGGEVNVRLRDFMDYALMLCDSPFTVGVVEEERDAALTPEMTAAPEHAHKMAATAESGRKMAVTTTPRHVRAASHEPSQVPADAKEPSQVPADAKEPSQVPADAKEPSQVPADAKEPSQVPADAKEPSQVPADAKEPSQVPADAKEPSQVPADAKEPSQVPADAKEPSQVPADAKEPSQVPADAKEPSQVPADAKEPSQVPADAKEPSQVPADAKEPSQVPADAEEPSQVPADAEEPSQVPADAEEPSQVPADVKGSSRATVDLCESSQVTSDLRESSQATVDRHESTPLSAHQPEPRLGSSARATPRLISQSHATPRLISQSHATPRLISQSHVPADQPESDHVPALQPESLHVSAEQPEPHQATVDHHELTQLAALQPAPPNIKALQSEPRHGTAKLPESVTPRDSRSILRVPCLVSSVRDVPLVSAHAAGIPKPFHLCPPVPELILLSEALLGWGSLYAAFGPHAPSLNCPRGWHPLQRLQRWRHMLQNLPKRWCSPQPLVRWWRPAMYSQPVMLHSKRLSLNSTCLLMLPP